MNRIPMLPLLLFSLMAPLAQAQSQSDGCEPLIQRSGVVSLAMQAGGRATVAVLNTNVLPIGMSRTLAQDLGLGVEPVPSRNLLWSAIPAIVGQVSEVPVSLFGQDLTIEQMYVMDNTLPFVALSLFMFDDFIIQLDLPKARLCSLNRSALNLKDVANLRMRNNNGRAAVQVAINQGEPVWLELQLEYPGALRLNHETAVAMGFADGQATDSSPGMGAGQADSLQFGPYELGNIAVAFPRENTPSVDGIERLQRMGRRGGGGGVDIAGAIGYDVLKHFVVTLDMETERLHVFVPQ